VNVCVPGHMGMGSTLMGRRVARQMMTIATTIAKAMAAMIGGGIDFLSTGCFAYDGLAKRAFAC
jgi:hypothetical protein